MGLFYITTHYQFQLDDLDEDFDTTCFVIADTARNAAEFWIQDFKEVTDIEIKYAGALTGEHIAFELHNRGNYYVVEIRDLSFDPYAQHGVVPWDTILPTHFQIVEV